MRGDGDAIAELDLKRPEQSLKLRQRAVPQLATGDDLRHPFSPVCREARRSAPFLRPRCDERGIGASGLEKSVRQGGGDRQRTRGRLEWEAGRAGSAVRGEKPADLLVQAPAKYRLAINFKAAIALGLEVDLD